MALALKIIIGAGFLSGLLIAGVSSIFWPDSGENLTASVSEAVKSFSDTSNLDRAIVGESRKDQLLKNKVSVDQSEIAFNQERVAARQRALYAVGEQLRSIERELLIAVAEEDALESAKANQKQIEAGFEEKITIIFPPPPQSGEMQSISQNPSAVSAPIPPAPSIPATAGISAKIDINMADAAKLEELKGIGMVIAGRIVEYRRIHGFFREIEDIKLVKGIGDAIFEDIKNEITVGAHLSLLPAPTSITSVSAPMPPPTPTLQLPSAPPVYTKLAISEIVVGIDDNANYEFIELYNPTASQIDLTGWTIKKKNSAGTVSSLVVASRFEGKSIPPGKHFLLAREVGYTATVLADVLWPSSASYNLAYTNNSLLLYDSTDNLVEEVTWTEIEKGTSFERDSWSSSNFHAQLSPTPQNLASAQ